MKWLVVLLATTALPLGWMRQARADFIIYSNFGPDQTYGAGYYSVSGGGGPGSEGPPDGYGHAIAESFAPTVNALFQSVALPLGYVGNAGTTNAFTIALMSDAGGHPGSILESFAVSDVPLYPDSAIETLVSTAHTPLFAGTTYWIAAIPVAANTAGGWFINSTGAIGVSDTGNDGLTWSAHSDPSAAFQVLGVQAVPEPSSLALLGVGGALLTGWQRRRKRGQAPA
jgi:hypothetical protein